MKLRVGYISRGKKCEVCGTAFFEKKSTEKYCSHKCSGLAYRENQKRLHKSYRVASAVKLPEKRCRQCSSMFTPTKSNQVYCCSFCRDEHNAEREAHYYDASIDYIPTEEI